MPSACMKPEKKTMVEVEEPIKQVITVVDKKVRNLEKRKGKLDEYKAKVEGGGTLNSDQKQAVSRYESVIDNLEYTRELQKQFTEIHEKAEKLLKKKLKAEQRASKLEEVSRVQEVLQLQNLLDSMGSEEAREHFKKGTKGAMKLSGDNLGHLDELYKLISPSRESGNSYAHELQAASEHMVSFIDGQNKAVVGTTYKELKQLVGQINQCGYFDKTDAEEEAEESPEAAPEAQESEATEAESAAPVEVAEESRVAHAEPAAAAAEPTPTNSAPQVQAQSTTYIEETLPSQVHASQARVGGSVPAEATAEESYFSLAAESGEKGREFIEIVSSVQGNFDFLQDSVITEPADPLSAAHVDPAVVAARSMPSRNAQQQQNDATSLPPAAHSYAGQTAAYGAATIQSQMSQLSTQAQDSTSQPQSQQAASSQYNTQSAFDPAPEQSWASAAEQSWGSSAAEHNSWVEQTTSQSWADQASHPAAHQPAWSNSANTQSMSQLGSDPPAPIPMPNETRPGQSLNYNADNGAANYSQVAADNQEADYEPRRSMAGKDSAGPAPAGYSNVDKDGFQTPGLFSPPPQQQQLRAAHPTTSPLTTLCNNAH